MVGTMKRSCHGSFRCTPHKAEGMPTTCMIVSAPYLNKEGHWDGVIKNINNLINGRTFLSRFSHSSRGLLSTFRVLGT